MALDVGDKTIGMAVTDEMGWSAQGLETIKRREIEKDIDLIGSHIKKYNVEKLVVGLPIRAEGEIGIQAKKVLNFIDKLKRGLTPLYPGLEIEAWDESMTTAEANEVLSMGKVTSKKRKRVIDKLAAVFILESYLRGKEG